MTPVHVHDLGGCAPAPLAHYLKALGVLRTIGRQVDAQARGWWEGDRFRLATTLDRDGLESFFLTTYTPTPMLAPWNGGTGFYPKDSKDGIAAIEQSSASRLSSFRQAIEITRKVVGSLEKSPKEEEKERMIAECRRRWRGGALEWLDAAVVLGADGTATYPFLLGTGGNDGRLDFTNNYMKRIKELLDCAAPAANPLPAAHPALRCALWGDTTAGLAAAPIGQFDPGGAGGANATAGFKGDPRVNPWDFILMLEGVVLFAGSIARRASAGLDSRAAAPFSVRPSAGGTMTVVDGEQHRGEQWMPLWDRPARLGEIQSLMAEGRCQVRARNASRPLDFARSIARLGTSRGIREFQRFGFIERNGQAHLAAPLGRWKVQPQPHQELLDGIARWVDTLRRSAANHYAPAGFGRVHRQIEDGMIACCREGRRTDRWRDLLVSLAGAELQCLRSPAFTVDRGLRPIPRLDPGWVTAADDDSAEFRLAVALAAQFGTRDNGHPNRQDPIRTNFVSIERGTGQFRTAAGAIARDLDVVAISGDLARDAEAIVERRVLAAYRSGSGTFPLVATPGTAASLADIAEFLGGRVHLPRSGHLARALSAVRWGRHTPAPGARPRVPAGSLALYGVLRAAHLPGPIQVSGTPVEVRLDPTIASRLRAGDLQGAIERALRRLRVSGLRPHLVTACGTAAEAILMLQALAFPLRREDMKRLVFRLTRPTIDEEDSE